MASVIMRLKILPKEGGTDLGVLRKSVEQALPQSGVVRRSEEEPIAYGLVALIVDLQCDEKEGVVDKIEESVRSTKGVSEVQVLAVSRI